MTLVRWLGVLVFAAFCAPLVMGAGGVAAFVAGLAAFAFAKGVLHLRGGLTDTIKIDLGGHLPAEHGHGHGDDHHAEGAADHGGGHGDHGHGAEPVKVDVPIWAVDPRWAIVLPVGLLVLGIAEFLLWWGFGQLGWEWNGYFAASLPIAAVALVVGQEGFLQVFEGRAAVRFFGRWVLLDGKPGRTVLFFLKKFFEVVEIPLLYPEKPEKKAYGPYVIRDKAAGSAEIIVDAVVQISPGDTPEDAVRIALFGGPEGVKSRIEKAIDRAFEELSADQSKPPFTYEEAISKASFVLFERAARGIDAARLGVQVAVSEIFVDGTEEVKKAAQAVFLQYQRNRARVAAATADITLQEMLMMPRSEGGAGMTAEAAERWMQTRPDLGGTGDVQYTTEAGDPDRQIRTADRRARKRRRAGRGGGDE